MLSRHHALSKKVRLLRRDPEARRRSGLLVAEGIHLASEALTSAAAIETAVIAPRLLETAQGPALVEALRSRGVPVEEMSDETLDGLQDARTPQPVLLLVRRETPGLGDVLRAGPAASLVVVACGVQDPGNLGSLVRSTEAASGTGFVALPGSADLTHPRTVRATMGSIFRLPAAEAPLDEVLAAASGRGLVCLGAARGGTSYDGVDWTVPLALFLGSEGAGLPGGLEGRLDGTVGIPMNDAVESLSVGAAGAVLLFEAARARRRVSRAG